MDWDEIMVYFIYFLLQILYLPIKMFSNIKLILANIKALYLPALLICL